MVLLFTVAPSQLLGQVGETDTTAFEEDDFFADEYFDEFDDEGYFEDDSSFFEEQGFGGEEASNDEFFDDEFSDDSFFDDEEFAVEEFDDTAEEFDEAAIDEEPADDLTLADDQAGEVELSEVEQKAIKERRIIRGYIFKVAAVSPWLVGLGLDQWWASSVDARISVEFPPKYDNEGIAAPFRYLVEITSYSFVNKYPSGGNFSGAAILGMLKFPVGPIKLLAGGGIYGFETISAGALFGATYRIPFIKFLDITIDSRMNYTQNGTPSGATYWFDVGGSIGFRF